MLTSSLGQDSSINIYFTNINFDVLNVATIMSKSKVSIGFMLSLLWAGSLLAAETSPQSPEQANSSARSVKYEPAFSGYQSFVDQDTGSWKAQNTKVEGAMDRMPSMGSDTKMNMKGGHMDMKNGEMNMPMDNMQSENKSSEPNQHPMK